MTYRILLYWNGNTWTIISTKHRCQSYEDTSLKYKEIIYDTFQYTQYCIQINIHVNSDGLICKQAIHKFRAVMDGA